MAICACISFTTCFFRLRWKKFALVLGGYGLVALITFQALATLAFGFGVWRTPFYRGLIDPLLAYGGGFGAWTVNWSFGFQILLNFVVPLLMAVLAGYSTKVLLLTKNLYLDMEYIYFQLTSFLWLCLSFKWVNMSLYAVWFSSAQLVILLAARLGKELELKLRGPFDAIGKCIPYAALTSILTFFYFYQDVRMPTVYGVQSYWNYSSRFKEVLTESKQTDAETTIQEISDEDISLIKMNTTQQERVCLISYYDWIYLTQAQRASAFIFLPSIMTPYVSQFQASVKDPQKIFIDQSNDSKRLVNVDMNQMLRSNMAGKYDLKERGRDLVLYERRQIKK